MFKIQNALFSFDTMHKGAPCSSFIAAVRDLAGRDDLPISVSWPLAQLIPAIDKASTAYHDARNKLIAKHGTKGADGNVAVAVSPKIREADGSIIDNPAYDAKKLAKFTADLDALNGMSADIAGRKITISIEALERAGCKLSASALMAIKPIAVIS